jgi:pimeloyl-ACP methyl ester carboxylesterase
MNRIPLLLLPGTLNDAALWDAAVAALGEHADIRIADMTAHDSTGALADAAIARMPPGPFAVAGFSLGGYVALEIMRRAGPRVTGLALLNTSARPETPEGRPGRQKMMALAQSDFARLTAMLIQFMLPAERQRDAALTASIRAMMERVGPEAFVRQSQAVMDRNDSRDLLAGIACPTLVIGAELDKVAPPALSQEMAAAVAGAELHLLPGTGHMAPVEQPAEVARLLAGWLARIPRPG